MSYKLSIIIPTYNRVEYLKECLNSIIDQNYSNLEIIVSDDNSTDGTENMVKNLQKDFNFIKYVKNKKYPQGPNGNKNNGLDNATGDIIGIFDDDDILLKGAINLLISKFNENYDIVMANCIRSDNNKFAGYGLYKDCEVKWEDYLCGKIGGEFWILFKKEIINKKRFDIDLRGGESTLWRGIMKKKRIYYFHKGVRLYRIHGESVSDNTIKYSSQTIKNYERDIEYYGNEMKKLCPCYLATIYKGAGFFAKFANEYKKGFKYLMKSIKLCPKYKMSYIMFILMFFPKKVILKLVKLKEYFEKN